MNRYHSSTGKNFILLLAALTFVGCSNTQSGPATVAETSAVRAGIADRVQFIENYVNFRRNYENLEYDVVYHNNSGGMIPGPSDWDVRLIAVVPPTEIDDWIPADVNKNVGSPPRWLRDLPGTIPKDGIVEWYRKSRTEVGIDRARSIIAYRNSTTSN